MTANSHAITGFTFTGFPGDAIRIAADGISFTSTILLANGGDGFIFDGAAATACIVSNCIVSGCNGDGVLLRDGATSNTLMNVFSYGNSKSGFVIQGAATQGNVLSSISSGVSETSVAVANARYGVHVFGGASGNIIGQPNGSGQISFISNNTMGGVLIEGAGTNANVLDHIWIGFDSVNPAGAGNGTGHGVEIRGGAANNAIGMFGLSRNIIISGHQGNGILITGVGTNGTTVQRTFVGGPTPSIMGNMTNAGHGIELADGVQGTVLGGLDESVGGSVEVDFTGPGSHALFINGNNATTPIMNTKLQFYHFGFNGPPGGPPIFGNDVIRVSGNVDTLQLGAPTHRNHTNSGTGYGIRLDGPMVRNVTTFKNHVGELFGSSVANTMGGILITNGVDNVTISGDTTDGMSYISGNGGPGITIDATGLVPTNITIRNTWVGLEPGDTALPNMGDGILIEGPMGTSPVTLTGITIGQEDMDLPNVISGNDGNGIRLLNVFGPKIIGNKIGTDSAGDARRANTMNGIDIDNCQDLVIGSIAQDFTGNLISGNDEAGIRIVNRSHNLKIHNNLIGTNMAGDMAVGNVKAGITIEAPGPGSGERLEIGGLNTLIVDEPMGDINEGNVISGNEEYGILISATLADTGTDIIRNVRIHGNHIGTNPAGDAAVANMKSGIRINGANAEFVIVGDRNERKFANLISGNTEHGIEIDEADGWRLWGNFIGLNSNRDGALGNGMHGISITKSTDGAIGTLFEGHAGNIISGNAMAGVMIGDDVGGPDFFFSHNFIGTDTTGILPVPNQDGILINITGGTTSPILTIGGENTSLDQMVADDVIQQGNVISGNTRDGIRVEAGRTGGLAELRIRGNFIGLASSGGMEIPNGMAGVRILGTTPTETTIGVKDMAQFGNVISGNGEDGIALDMGATGVEIARNLIGVNRQGFRERPNLRHGVFIKGASVDNEIVDNQILFNKKNGMRIEGAGTDRNRITGNSIHRNERRGIRIADGANGNIQPPTFQRRFIPGISTTRMNGKAPVGADLEIFADPIPFDDPGFWGQGKEFQEGLSSFLTIDGNGDFDFDPNVIQDNGIITAVAIDSVGNTSEFSPFMEPLAIQVVDEDPDLLVAGKPTIIRLFADSGKGGVSRRVTGGIFLNDTQIPGTAAAKEFVLRSFGVYNTSANEAGRMKGENSLNVLWPNPPAGPGQFEARMFAEGKQVGSVDLEGLNFQATNNIGLLLVTVDAPDSIGGTRFLPGSAAIMEAAYFFADVYPIDPNEFRRRLTFRTTPVVLLIPPHGTLLNHSLQSDLEKLRSSTTLRGGGMADYVAGFVSSSVGLNGDNTLYGSNSKSFGNDKAISILDVYPGGNKHTGSTLAHEIGHGPPFNLGDTYKDGGASTINPIPTDASRFDDSGILLFEEEYAYSPTGSFKSFFFDGPVWSRGDVSIPNDTITSVHDFMGVSRSGWVDPATYRVLFQSLGGSLAGRPAWENRRPSVPVDPALIVRGSVTLTSPTLSASLEPLLRPSQPANRDTPAPLGPIVLTVELQDAGGAVLDSESFSPFFDIELLGGDNATEIGTGVYDSLGSVFFSVVLRDEPGAARIVVKQGAVELATLDASAAPPVVTFIGPNGPGALGTGDVEVTWSATDADPGQTATLTYDVLYTPDDGATIIPLAIHLVSTTSLTVNTDMLPGPGPARFIVEASDGWNVGRAMSDPPMTVGDRPPTPLILTPEASDDLAALTLVEMQGAGIDPEDGILDGASMVWTIDGDPTPLGNGAELAVMLTAGMQTLRLTATDSFGNVAEDTLSIDVAEAPSSLEEILNFLLGLAAMPLQGDINQDGTVDVGDIQAARLEGL